MFYISIQVIIVHLYRRRLFVVAAVYSACIDEWSRDWVSAEVTGY